MGNPHEYTSGQYGRRRAFAEAVAALIPEKPTQAYRSSFGGHNNRDYAVRRADLLAAIREGYWEPLEPMPLDIKRGLMGITPEEYCALYLLIHGSAHTTRRATPTAYPPTLLIT